jgi:Ni/Co efflux regulator RcnB
MTDSYTSQWTLILSLTALLLSLAVLGQIASRYTAAYIAAPLEIAAFVDAVESSISENESYDRDVARLQRLEDKLRLGRLLREIQRGGDDLREELNGLLIGEDDSRLRTSARLLWANKRLKLEERVRRLDLLRMRFLVIYMSIVAGASGEMAAKQQAASKEKEKEKERDLEKAALHDHHHHHHERAVPRPGHLPRSLTEGIQKKPPLRRLTTQAIGHQENTHTPHRMGWAGVVKELQLSPRMHQRHASIERSMSQTPSSP